MSKNTSAIALSIFLLIAPAAFAGTGWTTDASGTSTPDNVAIGTAAPNYLITLRLARAATNSPSGDSQLAFGTNTATFYAFRLDTSNDLHFDRQPIGLPWNEGEVIHRNGVHDYYSEPYIYSNSRSSLRIFDTTAMGADVGGGLQFAGKYTSAGAYTGFAYIKGTKLNATSGDLNGILSLGVSDAGGNFLEMARLTTTGSTINGNVHVYGTLDATNVVAQYQDMAEWVPASGDVGAGTVVVIDPASNGVIPSSIAYQTSVAGVVSPQPGFLLGVEGDGKAKIATTGRVRVKVDATCAPIHRGDLLVSSGQAGVAMKSQPVEIGGVAIHRPGTVIGKALEPLESGTGEILVLLSLQ